MKKQRYLMNAQTGSVDTYDSWHEDYLAHVEKGKKFIADWHGLGELYERNPDKCNKITEDLDWDYDLIVVTKDENGDWVEVE